MYDGRRKKKKRMKNSKKKLLVASLCGLLVLTAGCSKSPKLENGKEVVASIDGKQIVAEDLYAQLKSQYGTSILVDLIDEFIATKEIETDQSAKDYAESQISQLKMQYQLAGRDFNSALISSGYKNEDELKDELIVKYKKEKVAENYVKDQLTEDEIKKYYESDIFGEITAKHILIKPETTSSMTSTEKSEAEKKALEKAKELIKKLNEGADFDTLAKENSDDTASASNGGLISDFSKDEVVKEFWEASVKLKDGKYTTEPVKSTYGYHIILRVSQKEKPSLDTVKDDIKEQLVEDKMENDSYLSQKSWAEIRKSYHLDIVDTDIKNIYDATISSLK